jgi:hypothetical protein
MVRVDPLLRKSRLSDTFMATRRSQKYCSVDCWNPRSEKSSKDGGLATASSGDRLGSSGEQKDECSQR